MSLKTKLLLPCLAIACLAGCKESREDKIASLFPLEKSYALSVMGTIKGLHANTTWPHVPSEVVQTIVVKHSSVDEVKAVQNELYSVKNYTDEEMNYYAYVEREAVKAFAEDKQKVQAAMLKKMQVMKNLLNDPKLKSPMVESLNAIQVELDETEKAFLNQS